MSNTITKEDLEKIAAAEAAIWLAALGYESIGTDKFPEWRHKEFYHCWFRGNPTPSKYPVYIQMVTDLRIEAARKEDMKTLRNALFPALGITTADISMTMRDDDGYAYDKYVAHDILRVGDY